MDVILGVSYAIGLLLIGVAATVYWANGSKTIALWFFIGGIIWAVLTAGAQGQMAIFAADKRISDDTRISVSSINDRIIAGQRVFVLVTWKNTGTRDAYPVRTVARLKSTMKGEPPPSLFNSEQNNGPPGMIAAGDTAPSALAENPIINQTTIDALNRGDVIFWVVGRVDYPGHSTAFRAVYSPAAHVWEYDHLEVR